MENQTNIKTPKQPFNQKQWYAEHREERRAYQKAYYAKTIEARLDYQRKWNSKNRKGRVEISE